MSTITWVHFSDLHSHEITTGWDAHRVLSTIVPDLQRMERDHNLRPDLLFFTGDAAFGDLGSEPGQNIADQFRDAEKLLEGARGAFTIPIARSNTFIVPGNHDVVRRRVSKASTSYLYGLTEINTIISHIQNTDEDWQSFMSRLDAYRSFLEEFGYDHLLEDPTRLIYTATREIRGHSVGIAGMNSAWSCIADKEKGKLWFAGLWQCRTLSRRIEKADISVALVHHPSSWFVEHEDPDVLMEIERTFTFHLHGHEHRGWVDARRGSHVRIAAAACYDRSERANGYNIVRLNMSTGECEVWLRQYDSTGGGWIPRIISGRTNHDGMLVEKFRDVSPPLGPKVDSDALLQALKGFAAIPNIGDQIIELTRIASGASTDASPVQRQIETAKALLDNGRAKAAIDVLVRLQDDIIFNNATTQHRTKIENILGACAVALDDFPAARGYFDTALAFDTENLDTIANKASVALLEGQIDEALTLCTIVRAREPRHENAARVLLQTLDDAGRYEELDCILQAEPWIQEAPGLSAPLGKIACNRGDFSTGIALLRRAITHDSANSELYLLTAGMIIMPLRNDLLRRSAIGSEPTEDERAKLREAEDLLTRAIQLLELRDNPAPLHASLVTRAAVFTMIGKLDHALLDCDRVLSRDPEERGALDNKGRVLMELDRPANAALCFERLLELPRVSSLGRHRYYSPPDQEWESEIRQLLANSYLNAGSPHQVITLIGELPEVPFTTNDFSGAELILAAHAMLKDERSVERTLSYIRTNWPSDPRAMTVLAEHFMRSGNLSEGIKLLIAAKETATGPLRTRVRQRLAYGYYLQRMYREAAEEYADIVSRVPGNQAFHIYIICLYYSGQLAESLSLAKQVRAAVGAVEGVAEVEAAVLEKGGDPAAALEVWQSLSTSFPTNYSYLVRQAFDFVQLLDHDAARSVVDSVPFASVKDDVDLLCNISTLRLRLDMPEVLRFGHRALRLGYGDPEIHMGYMSLCLQGRGTETQAALREPDEVRVGDAVHLHSEETNLVLTILDDEPVFADRHEIHKDNPQAVLLLGKRKGDLVILRDGMFGPEQYRIVDIQSKYVQAAHDTTRLFQSGTLHHPSLGVMDVSTESMDRFLTVLDRISQRGPDMVEMYRTQPMPLATLAIAINRPAIDVWLAMIDSSEKESVIYSATGIERDIITSRSTACGANGVVLDLLALLTIDHLEICDQIRARFDRIIVSQFLVDTLSTYEQIAIGPDAAGIMGKANGVPYFLDTPTGYGQRRRDLIERLIDFVKSVEVHPAMSTLSVEENFRKFLGPASLAAVMISQEQSLPLYSDDLRLRQIAMATWNVNGFDTQSLLFDLLQRQQLAETRYYAALRKLAKAGYRATTISVDCLADALFQAGFSISEEVRIAFQQFEGPECDAQSAVQAMAEVIKRIWLRPRLQHQKAFVLDLSLATLVAGRSKNLVRQLVIAVKDRFLLLELQLREVMFYINLWFQQH